MKFYLIASFLAIIIQLSGLCLAEKTIEIMQFDVHSFNPSTIKLDKKNQTITGTLKVDHCNGCVFYVEYSLINKDQQNTTHLDEEYCDFIGRDMNIIGPIKQLVNEDILWKTCPIKDRNITFENFAFDVKYFSEFTPGVYDFIYLFKLDIEHYLYLKIQLEISEK